MEKQLYEMKLAIISNLCYEITKPAKMEEKMKYMVALLVLLGILTFATLNYHFILFDDSLKVLEKKELTLDDTFVDARGAKKLKMLMNPALIEAGFKEMTKDQKK